MKFNESNNKSYSSHHTHTKSGHHKYTQSYSSNRNNNNDFDNTEDDGNAASNNVKYNNEEPNFDNGGTGKLFVVGYGSMNENQINTQTSYEVINKTIKSMNNIQNDNINSISQNDQENCFNTYPLNNASNKGKRPFDTVNSTNSDLNQYSDAIQTNQNNNNQYDNIPSISNTTINNNNSNNSNNSNSNSNNNNNSVNKNGNYANINNNNKHPNAKNSNGKNPSDKNNNYNNENQMKLLPIMNGPDHNLNYENEHYSYHDDLSVFWESEEENEENVSINESISEDELMTPQLNDERSSDLFRKNMESFRQKLLGSSNVRDRQNSTNSAYSSVNNGNSTYFSNLVTSVKRRSSNLSNLIFNHQNRDTNNAIELKSLDAYNLS